MIDFLCVWFCRCWAWSLSLFEQLSLTCYSIIQEAMRQVISSKFCCGKTCKQSMASVPRMVFRATFSDHANTLYKSCWVINPRRNLLRVGCKSACFRLNCLTLIEAAFLLRCVLTYVLSSMCNNFGSAEGKLRGSVALQIWVEALSSSLVYIHAHFPEAVVNIYCSRW